MANKIVKIRLFDEITGVYQETVAPETSAEAVLLSDGSTVAENLISVNAQLADIAINLNSEPIVIPEISWLGRLQRAIDKATIDGKNILFSNPVYDIGAASIYLKSNVALISFCGSRIQGNGALEVLKTDASSTYENIKLIGIGIDAGKVSGDDNIRVCSQFYNVNNLTIERCEFFNGSAAVGLDTCKNVMITKNFIFGMFQQTMSASSSPGTYGYGFVVNESQDVIISNNILGSGSDINGKIDRHAVYISTHLTSPTNSQRVLVKDNIVNMKSYTADAQMITGFEYAFKSFSGDNIEFDNNIVNGGAGGVLLSTKYINGGKIKVTRNTFVDCLKVGVLSAPDTVFTYSFDRVEIADNHFIISGEFAIGVQLSNTYQWEIKNNTFTSTIADITKKNPCYIVKTTAENNTVTAQNMKMTGNRIKGFKSVGTINKTSSFVCDDYVEDFVTASPWVPFTYVETVSRRDAKVRFLQNAYKFKSDTSAGMVGMTYFDDDFAEEIRCTSVSPLTWVNTAGRKVAGLSSARPSQAGLRAGDRYWEQDNARMVYWTGFAWSVGNNLIPAFGTTTEILALSTSFLGYSNASIYNTTDKTPYFWDALAAKWKTAAGTILV